MIGSSNTKSEIVEEEKVDTKYADFRSRVVCVPKENDVLLGRGGRVRDHEGNVYFRNLVIKNKNPYRNERLRFDRRRIAVQIYRAVRKRDGRFLKKMDGQWHEVKRKKAVDKTAQALREKYTNIIDKKIPPSKPLVIQNEKKHTPHKDCSSTLSQIKLHDVAKRMLDKSFDNKADNSSALLEENSTNFVHPNNVLSAISTQIKSHFPCTHNEIALTLPVYNCEGALPRRASMSIINSNVQNISDSNRTEVGGCLNHVGEENVLHNRCYSSYEDLTFHTSKMKDLTFHTSKMKCKVPDNFDPSIMGNCASDIIKKKETYRSKICKEISSSTNKKKESNNVYSFQDQLSRQIISPISCIGQSFLNKSSEAESKEIYELIADLKEKGEDGPLHLPIVIAQLCKRIKDLETHEL